MSDDPAAATAMTIVAAGLAALAVQVLLGRAGSGRLPSLAQQAALAPRELSPTLARAACALAGLAAWGVVGGVAGPVLAAAVVTLGPRGLARLSQSEDSEAVVARDLPLALDLLAACLIGGAVPAEAVQAVSAAVPGPCGDRLATVAARLAVGSDPAAAWRALGDGRGAAGAAARALCRAAIGGAPVASSVQRVADDARRQASAQAARAARRAGVLAVGPLGLCFLPAFLLLGVVPAVIGLATPLLRILA
jgi:Flp pilus assembly protein TadB